MFTSQTGQHRHARPARNPYHRSRRLTLALEAHQLFRRVGKRALSLEGVDEYTVETLETRKMLAGNVSVAVSGQDISIKGDGANNFVQVTVDAASEEVRLLGIGTNISGLPGSGLTGIAADDLQNLTMKLKGGDDIIQLGKFASITIPDLNVGGTLKVITGGGDDSVQFNQFVAKGDSLLKLGGGEDSTSINNSRFDGDVVFRGGGSADWLSLGLDESVIFNSDVDAKMGGGNDTVCVAAIDSDPGEGGTVFFHGNGGQDAITALPPGATMTSFELSTTCGQPTILFEDDFDEFSTAKWTVSGSGTAVHDPTLGASELGSLKLSGDVSARAFASSFSVAAGLEIHVSVRIPDSSMAGTSVQSALMIEIESAELGTGNALVRFWRAPCSFTGVPTTIFDYYISAPSGGGNTLFYEEFNCTSAPDDRFVDFTFIVNADGSTAWERDGVTMLSFAPNFGSGGVRLKLHGGQFTAGTPDSSLWYDDVSVVVPNAAQFQAANQIERETIDVSTTRADTSTSNLAHLETLPGSSFDAFAYLREDLDDAAGQLPAQPEPTSIAVPVSFDPLKLPDLDEHISRLEGELRPLDVSERLTLDVVPKKLIQPDMVSELAVDL